jgi:hypothetical protein
MDINLLHGWFTPLSQVLAIGLLLAGVAWKSPRMRDRLLPGAVVAGATVAGLGYGVLAYLQLVPETAPATFWWFAGMLIGSVLLVIAGRRYTRRWQQASGVAAVPALLLCLLLAANQWSGYFTTTDRAYDTISDATLPNQVSETQLADLRAHPPEHGVIVPIEVPRGASGFRARTEYVYLPPAWFDSATPPALPVIELMGAVVNTTRDWVWSGDVIDTVDAYRARHGGTAPILVLADTTGSVLTDTGCVNGPRGNADTHLAVDLPRYVQHRFDTAPTGARWAAAGWSMGGTCALTLALRHPDVFATFVDLGGDATVGGIDERAGAKTYFGGDTADWAAFDPVTVMRRHGAYPGMAGWVAPGGRPPRSGNDPRSSQADGALIVMPAARRAGIDIRYDPTPVTHTWEAAAGQFRQALPWTMDRLAAAPAIDASCDAAHAAAPA